MITEDDFDRWDHWGRSMIADPVDTRFMIVSDHYKIILMFNFLDSAAVHLDTRHEKLPEESLSFTGDLSNCQLKF
jgi:hypothetical protein